MVVCFAVALHHVKQVHCCTWKYVCIVWHFASDEVWGNLQDSFTNVQVNCFGSTCQVEACSSSHPYNSSAIQQNKSLFPLPLLFLLLQVWLYHKHFCMILEQRRFYQLLHWQTFSYWEKATCSIVASHCMTKHDVLTCASTPVAAAVPGLLLQIQPEINLSVYLQTSPLSNNKDVPVTTNTCVPAYYVPFHYPSCSFSCFISD